MGRTHLFVGVALNAIGKSYGANFVCGYNPMDDLRKARAEHNLEHRMRVYMAPKVLIVEESGIWPYEQDSASAFFTLVSARVACPEPAEVNGFHLPHSNKRFGDWGKLLGDTLIASAILDLLLHHSHVLKHPGRRLQAQVEAGGGSVPAQQHLSSRQKTTLITPAADRITG